ncbi:hypothetical protein [Poriferisphaera sp. WC338]|uniref:hypothetical protein n=1 Tax=Poriferisphaera sp. WC338 TaxID=3425129 RepID=UPI003D813D27
MTTATTGPISIEKPQMFTGKLTSWAWQYRWAIVGSLLALYLIGFSFSWRPGGDSALHLCYARDLLRSHTDGMRSALYQPLSPGMAWVLAACMHLFGEGPNAIAAGLTIWLAIASITLLLVYQWFSLFCRRGEAVFLTASFGITETFYSHAYELLPDIPFALGSILMLLGVERLQQSLSNDWCDATVWWQKKGVLRSVFELCMGIVIMSIFRSVVIVFVSAVILTLFIKLVHYQKWRILIFTSIAIFVFTISARWLALGVGPLSLHPDEKLVIDLITQTSPYDLLTRMWQNIQFLLTEAGPEGILGQDLGPIISIPIGLILFMLGLRLFRRRLLWGILFCAFIVQWILVLPVDRYFIPITGLITLAIWDGLCWLESLTAQKHFKISTKWLTPAIVIIWLGCNLATDLKVFASRFENHEQYRRNKYLGIPGLAADIHKYVDPAEAVLAPTWMNMELSWWSDRVVMNQLTATHFSYAILPLSDEGMLKMKQAKLIPIKELANHSGKRGRMYTLWLLAPEDHLNQ